MAVILDFRLERFYYVKSTGHPDDSYQVTSQLAFLSRRRSKNDIFKMVAKAAIMDFLSEQFKLFLIYKKKKKKGKRKVQRVPQLQTAALPRPQEEEKTDKSKQAQIDQTYEKH